MNTGKPNHRMLLLLCTLAFTPALLAETSPDSAEPRTSFEDVEKETTELLRALKNYSVEQRDKAVQETEAALDNLDRRIDALEAGIDENWDQMDRAARQQARSSLSALRKQRTRVAEWYGGLKNSSTDAWGHMKEGFSKAYRSLSNAWEKSEKEFGGKP